MATTYYELSAPWTYKTANQELEGRRVFGEDPTGVAPVASLPAIGDAFPSVAGLLCRSLLWEKWGGHPTLHKITVDYGNADRKENITESTTFADLPRSLNMSGEVLALDVNGKNTVCASPDTGKLNNPLYKRIITATLTIPKVYTSHSTLLTSIGSYAGKVNNDTWESYATTHWLFTDVRSVEYRNPAGNLRWRAEFSFQLRVVPLAVGVGGWNYIWSYEKGKFVQVTAPPGWPAGQTYPYQSADFTVTGLFV